MVNSSDKLIDLLNTQFNPTRPFTTTNVKFGLPTPVTSTEGNTKVTITGISTDIAGYYGVVEQIYYRVDLARIGDATSFISYEEPTEADIVSAMSELDGTFFDTDEVKGYDPSVVTANTVADVVMSAETTSLGWYGNVTIQVLWGVKLITDNNGKMLTDKDGSILIY